LLYGCDVRRFLVLALTVSAVTAAPTTARAACAAPGPDTLSFREMIEQGTTGDDFYHRMIIGRVVAIRDPSEKGGEATAIVAVAAHPTGFVPLVARVRFYRPPPGVWVEDNVEFHVGQRWVIIARHVKDGSYRHDGGCGQTQRVSLWRFKMLIALDRTLN
jgi:hypothetical protein